MLYLLYLLLSCGAKKYTSTNVLELTEMVQLDDEDCVESLKKKLSKSNCPELNFTRTSEYDFLLICAKEDKERTSVWDSNIFRISYINMSYSDDDYELVQKHTVCTDGAWRVEIYSPN